MAMHVNTVAGPLTENEDALRVRIVLLEIGVQVESVDRDRAADAVGSLRQIH